MPLRFLSPSSPSSKTPSNPAETRKPSETTLRRIRPGNQRLHRRTSHLVGNAHPGALCNPSTRDGCFPRPGLSWQTEPDHHPALGYNATFGLAIKGLGVPAR